MCVDNNFADCCVVRIDLCLELLKKLTTTIAQCNQRCELGVRLQKCNNKITKPATNNSIIIFNSNSFHLIFIDFRIVCVFMCAYSFSMKISLHSMEFDWFEFQENKNHHFVDWFVRLKPLFYMNALVPFLKCIHKLKKTSVLFHSTIISENKIK